MIDFPISFYNDPLHVKIYLHRTDIQRIIAYSNMFALKESATRVKQIAQSCLA